MNERNRFLSLRVRPWGMLTAAGAVACGATLLGYFGRFHWFLDLFSHFRAQYTLGLGVLGLFFLASKRKKMAIVCVAFAAANTVSVLPMYFGLRPHVHERQDALRVMLLNVNTRQGNPERVKQAILELQPDLLVLEEISARWVDDLDWLGETHPHSAIEPREDNFGIGLFSRYPIIARETVYVGDALVPTLVARVESPLGRLGIVATHPLPPGGAAYSDGRNDQLRRLPEHIPDDGPVLLVGDLNVTPWNHYFKKLLKDTELQDSAVGFGVQPTWPAGILPLLIPIDHVLHSRDIAVLDRRVGPDVGSDHLPLIVDFAVVR